MSIQAQQGKSFSVTLRANLGSTPLGWCLTEMPAEIMFYYQENIRTTPIGTDQTFHFIARDKGGQSSVNLKFALVNFATAEETEEVVIPVEITPAVSENEAGKDKFIEFDGNTATYNANKLAIDYAFPPVGYAFDASVPMPPYGVLPSGTSCIPAVPYGVLPAWVQSDYSCVGMAYQTMPRSAFQDCPYGMYNMVPRSRF